MQQNEQDYLTTLKDRLVRHVSQEDLDDILSDYSEHFSIGKAEGRSEEELCQSLGSPDDVAREILASYLVKRAEQARSAGNIWHAVMATLGLGLFNLVVVLIPFIILIALLTVIFVSGVLLVILGPLSLLVAILQLLGMNVTTPWSSPLIGILVAIGLSILGVFLVMAGLHLSWFFYRLGIRYLKWNIRIIRGGAHSEQDEKPGPATITIPRDEAQSLDLQIRFGAGDLSVGEGTGGQTLVDLTAPRGTACARPSVSLSADGMGRQVRIRGRHTFDRCWWSDEPSTALGIGVNRDIPIRLEVMNKAGRTALTLGTLDLAGLRVKNGAGETRIDLTGYTGRGFDAEIKNGVGSLAIRVPKEYRLLIRVHRGIGDTDVHGLLVEGDMYVNRPERKDAPQITIFVKQGVGSLSLEAV